MHIWRLSGLDAHSECRMSTKGCGKHERLGGSSSSSFELADGARTICKQCASPRPRFIFSLGFDGGDACPLDILDIIYDPPLSRSFGIEHVMRTATTMTKKSDGEQRKKLETRKKCVDA